MDMALLAGLAASSVGATAIIAALGERREEAIEDAAVYLQSLDEGYGEPDEFKQLLAEPFLSRVLRPLGSRVLGLVAGVLPLNYRDRVREKLVQGGLAGRFRAEEFITGQVLAGAIGFLLALAWATFGGGSSRLQLLALVLLPAIGVLLPSSWLQRTVNERKDAIRKDIPDTLDLMAISVEAGMGFEGALSIVGEHFDSPLADEFSRTLKEMELGLPRREALQNLKRRTEVPELSNFVLALTQADSLGMPIGRVLKTQAAEMRMKRRQWAREKAAKLPVKILFPLILFIFPPLFIIVLGPAASDISNLFGP